VGPLGRGAPGKAVTQGNRVEEPCRAGQKAFSNKESKKKYSKTKTTGRVNREKRLRMHPARQRHIEKGETPRKGKVRGTKTYKTEIA